MKRKGEPLDSNDADTTNTNEPITSTTSANESVCRHQQQQQQQSNDLHQINGKLLNNLSISEVHCPKSSSNSNLSSKGKTKYLQKWMIFFTAKIHTISFSIYTHPLGIQPRISTYHLIENRENVHNVRFFLFIFILFAHSNLWAVLNSNVQTIKLRLLSDARHLIKHFCFANEVKTQSL